ncbi:Eukaryotic translation initiation factor 3 subunit C, partial [Rhizoclosmatium sp. JEL0117]
MSRFFNKKQAAATQKKIAVAADSDASSNSDADSDADSDENNSMFAAQSSQSQSQKKAATSRFGRALAIDSDSDSDSDSDDDSDDSDDSDAPRKKPLQKQQLQPTLIRDKRFDEMRNIIKPLMNAKKINDWVSIQNEFDRLNNAYQKVASIQPDEKLPHPFRFYYRALATLEDAHKAHTESGKTLNAVNQKAFTGMKSKLKKLCKTKEEEIASWRENPLDEEASEAEAIELARSLAAPAGGAIDAGDESDDSIFGKDDDDSDSDSEPEIDEEADKNLTSWERVLKKFGRTPKKDDDGSDSDEDGGKKKLTKEEKKIARVARKVTIAEEAVAAAPVAPTA